jgi:AraC family transcriptional regulator
MSARIMQSVSGRARPLSFDGDGSTTLLLDSASTPWAGLQLEMHRTIPGEIHDAGPLDGELALVVFLEGSVEMTILKRKGEAFAFRAAPGSTSFLSGDNRSSTRVTGSATVVAFKLTPEWFHRAELDQAPAGFGRQPSLAADKTLHWLASAACREVQSGAITGRLYGESLSLSLLSYATERIPVSRLRVTGALSEAQRRRLAQYIRDRLGEDLALSELAGFVGLGPRQFTRVFREAFGVTPHRYVLNQRLDEGARHLENGLLDITEIALSLGFSSQSHFAAAFRKRFDETPRKYAFERRRRRSIF